MCFAEKYCGLRIFACLEPTFTEVGCLADWRPRLADGLAALELQGGWRSQSTTVSTALPRPCHGWQWALLVAVDTDSTVQSTR
jgi:hypothetical protein